MIGMTVKYTILGIFLFNLFTVWTLLGRYYYNEYYLITMDWRRNNNTSSYDRHFVNYNNNYSTIVPMIRSKSKIIMDNTAPNTENNNDATIPHNIDLPLETNMKNNKILVVYSGPTSLVVENDDGNTAFEGGGGNSNRLKDELYMKNFEYFLHHGGVNCQHHDTLLLVTEEVFSYYYPIVKDYQKKYCNNNTSSSSSSSTTAAEPNQDHFVRLVVRENVCLDMESVRLVLYGLVNGVDVNSYDYLIYINCGMSGPAPSRRVRVDSHRDEWSWTDAFTERFRDDDDDDDDRVRMVGISHNCFHGQPHIQSMAYALDRKGIQLIRKSRAVYDCRTGDASKGAIIHRYEIGMSRYLMTRGYAVRSILRNTTLTNFTGPCDGLDIWMTHRLQEAYGGRLPSIHETIFYKSSRVMTQEIAQLINWTRPINWNW